MSQVMVTTGSRLHTALLSRPLPLRLEAQPPHPAETGWGME